MKAWIFRLLCLCLFYISSPAILAEASPVRAELISKVHEIQPGQTFLCGVLFKIDPGWHIYGQNPGDAGMPTSLAWTLPKGFEAGEIRWPRPHRFEFTSLVSFGYQDEVLLMVPIQAPASLPLDQPVTLNVRAEWLACKEACIPGNAMLHLTLPVKAQASENPQTKPLFEKYQKELAAAESVLTKESLHTRTFVYLFSAFVGGFLLNLMPCVFPVLSLKVLGFVRQAGEDKKKLRFHGLIFTGGVLVSFWVLTGLLLALRAAGNQLGWGFQLQSPLFVGFLALLLTGLALNLFGLFEMGQSLALLGGKRLTGWTSSFFSGVLTTIVATPCTGPFMGSALAFGLTQSALISLLIFTSLALGLSLPYVLLAFYPAWLQLLPKPNAWMESFKQCMAFPLLSAALWLIWVLGQQTGVPGMTQGLTALLIASLGLWIYGRWGGAFSRHPKLGRLLSVIALSTAIYLIFQLPEPGKAAPSLEHEPFSAQRVETLLQEGRPVFINFTAAWCLTCQVNKAVLKNEKVVQKFREKGIIYLVADWTNQDPAITEALKKYGRTGVPTYVLLAPGQPPYLLPEVLTPSIVLQAVDILPSY